MNKLPAQPVKGLIDGLIVLQELAVQREPVSGLSLANKLGLEKTRVNRLLKTLTYMELTCRTSHGQYLPGPGMHILAVQSLLGSGLITKAVPVLEELLKYGHVVALGILWRDTVSYLYHGQKGKASYAAIASLSLYPATQSSIGMLLLAAKDADEVANIYAGKEIPDFKNISELQQALTEIRETGFAALMRTDDRTSIAVKIGNPTYAGIAMSGKINQTQEAVAILKTAAMEID